MSDKPFAVNLGKLRRVPKPDDAGAVARAEEAGEALGFADREPRGRRGRQPSPRTGQVHAKVLPGVSEAIAAEARRRGVQQGVVIEEAWGFYLERRGRDDAGG